MLLLYLPLRMKYLRKVYPECSDVTLFSDSGQLLYPHWKRTAKDIWKADESIVKAIHTPNLTMDWYHMLYNKYGEKLKYLYASSTHDYLLSAYYNDITYKTYRTNSDVQAAFYGQLRDMAADFKNMSENSGLFINEWKNLNVMYPGLRGERSIQRYAIRISMLKVMAKTAFQWLTGCMMQ